MTTTETTTPVALSHEQIAEMLDLLKGSDSVELKLTVPEHDQRSTVVGARHGPARGADPPGLLLRHARPRARQAAASSSRARRIQGKGDDSVVKLRPVVPSELPTSCVRSAGFSVEVDALPGGFVCSGTLKGTLDRATWSSARRRRALPLRKLFSKEQRAFFAEHAPEGIDARRPVGARADLRAQAALRAARSSRRRLVAEMWLYPDGSRMLELSTRCATTEAFQVAAETRAFLADHGVDLSGEQQTKTRRRSSTSRGS